MQSAQWSHEQGWSSALGAQRGLWHWLEMSPQWQGAAGTARCWSAIPCQQSHSSLPAQVGTDLQPGHDGGSGPRQAPLQGVWCRSRQALLSLPERVVLLTVREPCHPLQPLSAPRAPQVSLENAVGGPRKAKGPSTAQHH